MALFPSDDRLSPEEIEDAYALCSQLLHSEELTEWEEDFLQSTMDRIDQYGDRTFFSASQQDQLDRLARKYR